MDGNGASEVVILDGARTPHGELVGSLADVAAVELGQIAIDGILERVDLAPEQIEWVSLGNAIQAGIGQVPARQAVIRSALPNDTAVTTINEASGSGVRAICLAADRVATGRIDIALAGGFESMSNAPWILPDYRKGRRHGHVTARDSMILDSLWDMNLDVHMGEITEGLVDREGIERTAQDEYALESHQLAADAIESGVYDEELVPVETPAGVVDLDEGPRPDSTLEDLASLRPAFARDGTITAGNASKLSDGAGGVVMASAATAEDLGLDPTFRLRDYEVVYREPDEFNEAVGDVIERLLEANQLDIGDIDTFWVNEAFSAQSVYVMDRLDIPREQMNPLGGAVAYGHPIGASGGMLAASVIHQLARDGLDRGLVGMSIGGGGAIMALIERR